MARAELQVIDRAEVIQLSGRAAWENPSRPPAWRRSREAGRGVFFASLADIFATPVGAEREGMLREKIRYFWRFLLIVDKNGYVPITPGGGNLFFEVDNDRHEKGSMIAP